MKFIAKKKAATAVAIATLALGIGGAAFAYFTGTGTTTGSGTVGSETAFTLTQTSTISGLLPGADPTAIYGSIHNNSASNQYAGDVTITGVSVDEGHSGCNSEWFSTSNASTAAGEITGNSTATSVDFGSIYLTESHTNQSACEGATITVSYSL